jgi:hypothetical protein
MSEDMTGTEREFIRNAKLMAASGVMEASRALRAQRVESMRREVEANVRQDRAGDSTPTNYVLPGAEDFADWFKYDVLEEALRQADPKWLAGLLAAVPALCWERVRATDLLPMLMHDDKTVRSSAIFYAVPHVTSDETLNRLEILTEAAHDDPAAAGGELNTLLADPDLKLWMLEELESKAPSLVRTMGKDGFALLLEHEDREVRVWAMTNLHSIAPAPETDAARLGEAFRRFRGRLSLRAGVTYARRQAGLSAERAAAAVGITAEELRMVERTLNVLDVPMDLLRRLVSALDLSRQELRAAVAAQYEVMRTPGGPRFEFVAALGGGDDSTRILAEDSRLLEGASVELSKEDLKAIDHLCDALSGR